MGSYIQAISDTALRIEWPGDVSLDLNDTIISFCSNLQVRHLSGVIEWVPAYKSVTIYYSPYIMTHDELCKEVQDILQMDESSINDNQKKRTISVPVYYGRETGPDLERVAHVHAINEDEVVKRHQEPIYFIYMLGFLPGFPYLGGLDKTIATPRLETARQETPKGSVGIAHHQTGIYPIASPGGWNIIGKTPISLMDLSKQHPFLFQAGDYVRFYSVTKEEFKNIEQKVDLGTYKLEQHIRYEG